MRPVRTVLGALSCALSGASAGTAQDPGVPFTLRQVSPGVYAAIDRDARAGANAGFVIGDDGVVIIDSFQFPEAAESLLTAVRRITPLPIRYVVSTHHHIDHVAGNEVFRRAGAEVIAHRNVAGWIRTENLKFFRPDQTKERSSVERLPLPDVLVDGGLSIRLGSRRLEIRMLPGHSGGDLVVAVPDAKVLFTGDLAWRRFPASIVDATVSTWIETLDGLRKRIDAAEYTYVMGQGDVATLADLADFQGFLVDLTAVVKRALDSGATGDALVAAALPRLEAKYGTWSLFKDMAPRQIPLMAAELSGTKRLPRIQPASAW